MTAPTRRRVAVPRHDGDERDVVLRSRRSATQADVCCPGCGVGKDLTSRTSNRAAHVRTDGFSEDATLNTRTEPERPANDYA